MGRLVGDAHTFRTSVARLPAIARANAAVLISGETGTGKELIARAIHYLSPRASGPFTAVNCGTLPDSLLEDELFGHERGAYTDARDPRAGLLSHTAHGTLLLDEVDCLTPRAQVALLRVLQDHTFRALGSNLEQHADVRVVAASNLDLWSQVEIGRFRADLFYRLGVLTVHLPPLRDRAEDILPLTHHFLLRYASEDRPGLRLSPEAKQALMSHRWPGNVRELENAVLRAVSLTEGDVILAGDLGLSIAEPSLRPGPGDPAAASGGDIDLSRPFGELKSELVASFERAYLKKLLTESAGNVSRAARRARKERRDFGRLLKKHRLDPRAFSLKA